MKKPVENNRNQKETEPAGPQAVVDSASDNGELSDADLENVSGGGDSSGSGVTWNP